jgi:hypothetical protein
MTLEGKRLVLALLAVTASLSPGANGQEFHLRADDCVVFFNDSGPASPEIENLIETYVLNRFPQWNVTFTHVSSRRDLSSLNVRPSVIVVRATDVNSPGFGELLEKTNASGMAPRVTILGTAAASERIGGSVQVDIAGMLTAAAAEARSIDSGLSGSIFSGGAARGPAGSLLIAAAILQAWHATAVVSAVEIDALRGAVARADNTTVRDMENGRVIAWTQDDQALPLPLDIMDPSVMLAIHASGLPARLDSQMLRVRGMAAERYTFTIDGELVGVFHRDQLDIGINLALLRTPMWKQAMSVLALTRRLGELQATRRRLLETTEQQRGAEWRAAMEALDTSEADLTAEQRTKAKAGTHDYEFQPVGQ